MRTDDFVFTFVDGVRTILDMKIVAQVFAPVNAPLAALRDWGDAAEVELMPEHTVTTQPNDHAAAEANADDGGCTRRQNLRVDWTAPIEEAQRRSQVRCVIGST